MRYLQLSKVNGQKNANMTVCKYSLSNQTTLRRKLLLLLPVPGTVSNSHAKKMIVPMAELVDVFLTVDGLLSILADVP